MVHAFQHGQDVHRRTAAEVLGIAIEDVTNDQRRQAKAVNFGLLYGMSEFGLIRQLGFTRQESKTILNNISNAILASMNICNAHVKLHQSKALLKPF